MKLNVQRSIFVTLLILVYLRIPFVRSESLDMNLVKLDLTACETGKQAVSSWKDGIIIKLDGEFRHNDHINYITTTILESDHSAEGGDIIQNCSVLVYTYIDGADTSYVCSFPSSLNEFGFPPILSRDDALQLFDEGTSYCGYSH